MKATLLAVLLLLLLAPGGPVSAQSLPPLPHTLPVEEAPPALFSAQIGDAEVDFVLDGSWRTEVAAALGLVITPAGEVYVEPFPDFGSTALIFRNYPRLSFSIWLEQRYFVEASFIGDFTESQSQSYNYFDENYLLAGYRGKEGEFLRSVLIGNREVGIDPYPFLEVPETGSSSLGASALLGAGRSSHQLLLRYDNNEPAEAVFLGKNRVEESTLQLDKFIRGRFFRLPDADVGDLEVYLEDSAGAYSDGTRRYRLATVDDATLDAAGGTVTLKKAAAGAVLVFYRKGGLDIGDASLGDAALPQESLSGDDTIDLSLAYLDFAWNDPDPRLNDYFSHDIDERQVTVNGKLSLRLWKPGEFSPFEILAAYAAPSTVPTEASRMRVQVLAKGNPDTTLSSGVKFRLTPGTDYLTAYRDTDLRGNLRNLYPFLDEDLPAEKFYFDPDNLLYGPSADPSPGYIKHELRVSLLTPVTSFGLGADVVPGSVQVLRNGVAENRFEFDADLGVVSFLTEIAPDDRLVISFRRKQSLAGNGDLLFVWGNTIPLGDSHILQLATGLRWNAVPGTYTEEAYARTGSALVSAGIRGEAGPLRYEVSAAAGITNPDTTGRLRLLGMEGQGMEIPLSESTAWPAAPPANAAVAPGVLDAADRGILYYKDLPYASGSKPGPYIASENLVLDFDLASGEWVGTQIPVAPGQGPADLSGLKSISMSYRAPSVPGTFRAYLQIGDVGEDLDADGKLDEEASASSAGFLFDDTLTGHGILRVGTNAENLSNGRRDSEDVDGNGTLDPEDAGSVPYLLVPLDTNDISVSGTSWTPIFHSFDAAERSRLSRARSVRLLLVNTAGPDFTGGRFEVQSIVLEGSLFHGSTNVTAVREIEEWASNDPPPKELVKAFPEVSEIFHPYAETQKVLEVEWSGGPWSVNSYTHAPSEGIDYRRIVYYCRLPVNPGGTLDFDLEDAAGKGIHWHIPAALQDAWSKIEVSLDDKVVYRNGAALAGGAVTVNAARGSLSRFTVSQGASATAGSIYLDELHLTDPKSTVGAAAKGWLELELPGTLVAWGGHPVLHDLFLRQEASAGTRGFAALYGIPLAESSFSSRTELAVGISIVDLGADLQVAASGSEVSLAGGHRLGFPSGASPVRFEDSYHLSQGPAGQDLARGNRLSVTLGRIASLGLDAEAISQEGLLTQSWSADLGITPPSLDLRQGLELTETRSGFEVPKRDYFSDWIWAYSLLAPYGGGVEEERLTRADFVWSLATRPLGARLAGSYDTYSAEILSGRTQTNTLSLEASLPWTVRRQQVTLFSLTPGYRRRVELTERLGSTGDLASDLGDGLGSLAGQEYWFRGVPLAELFSSAVESDFSQASLSALTAAYTPEVFLNLSRFASSRWYDLVVPSALELSLNRELAREGVLVGSSNNYRIALQSRALNLFGALGAYPLFPFYRTDEASGSLQLTATRTEGTTEKLSLLAGQYLACDGETAKLTLENRFVFAYAGSAVWSDAVGALFSWERHPPAGVRLPLLPAAAKARAYWSHQESLSTTLAGGEPFEESATTHPVNLVLAHQTSLVLPESGYLKGGVSLGLDAEKVVGEGMYWRLGLKLSLEAQLQF